MLRPFHLAIPVTCLDKAEAFYGGLLNCEKGRSDAHWIDWNFFGHQLVTHVVEQMPAGLDPNKVDNKQVPVPHFGVVLTMQDWQTLSDNLSQAGTPFIIEPYIRFAGEPGEQATCFLLDPFGNALEFKAFHNLDNLFKA